MYAEKGSFGRQDINYKKQLKWTECILQKVVQVNKIYNVKGNFGIQNMSCKK